MTSDLDFLTPSDGERTSSSVVASVRSVNAAARLVKVAMPGGSVLELAAMPGRYRVSDAVGVGLARVLLDEGRPVLVQGPLDPLDPVVPASMTASAATTATVSWAGGSYTLPYLAGSYGTLPRDVWISLSDWGIPVLVHGPSAVAPPPPPPPPPDPGPAPTVQVVQAIAPQWSGSYRQIRSAWDRWNTDRYGGRSTLWQGDLFGSGPLVGYAAYGTQVANLGALSIDRIQVAIRNAGAGSGPATLISTLQNFPAPSGGPSGSGATATGEGWVDLPPSVFEAWRTGVWGGLALVGGNYAAFAGAGNGDGMTLVVTYTRNA